MHAFQNEAAELKKALGELQAAAGYPAGNLIAIGCSSSEILGAKIGASTNMEVSKSILRAIMEWAGGNGLHIAIQCCEHLNRCLVVEEDYAETHSLEIVNVVPYAGGGGGLSAAAMEMFERPVVVISLNHSAHGGIDIGNTFIGMHLRRVAVCVRLSVTHIGMATINCVKTRPMLIGGDRSRHNPI